MAGPKLTASRCPTCSAPISVGTGDQEVRCHYCGTVIQVERKKPPPQPMPHTVYVAPSIGWGWGAFRLLFILPALIPVLILTCRGMLSGVKAKTGSFPLTCGVNETLEIDGREFSGTGTLITAGVNCKLFIKNSKLKGDLIIASTSNPEITIENSTLEGKSSAIEGGGNMRLKISKKSTITSAGDTIVAGTNGEITIEGSKVTGTDRAVRGPTNTKIKADSSVLEGAVTALQFEQNGTVDLRNTQVTSQRIGLVFELNARISLDGSTLTADQGIRARTNAHLRMVRKSKIASKSDAINFGDNAEIECEDSSLETPAGTAIRLLGNGHVQIEQGSKIRAGETGLEARNNLELSVQGSNIEANGSAISAERLARIELRKSQIKGGKSAIDLAAKPTAFTNVETTIVGPQNLDGKTNAKR